MIRSRFEDLRRRKAFQENRNLSLRKVAEESGLSFGTILRVKAEFPSRIDAETLSVLCDYFDVEVGDLLQRALKPAELDCVRELIEKEGALTMATEEQIRAFYLPDALISLKGQAPWVGHERILEYYDSFNKSALEEFEYSHRIEKMDRTQGGASAISQTLFRETVNSPQQEFLWQVWDLERVPPNKTNPLGWAIARFMGGFSKAEAQSAFDDLNDEK